MDAAAFLDAIAARLKQAAQIMSRKYPTVGMTADDFEQEATLAILKRLPKYDASLSEPWTFAHPTAHGAMIDAALRGAKSVEFFDPKQIRQISDERSAYFADAAETGTIESRFTKLADSLGVRISSLEMESLVLAYGKGLTRQEAASSSATAKAHQRRIDKVHDRFRSAAGAAGIVAFG